MERGNDRILFFFGRRHRGDGGRTGAVLGELDVERVAVDDKEVAERDGVDKDKVAVDEESPKKKVQWHNGGVQE